MTDFGDAPDVDLIIRKIIAAETLLGLFSVEDAE